MVRSYVCERCWENKCQNCGSILASEAGEGCLLCGTPSHFA